MFVKLKDGSIHNVTNENDVANIIEQYLGSELAELVRNSDYTKMINFCFDTEKHLSDFLDGKIDGTVSLDGKIEMTDVSYNMLEGIMLDAWKLSERRKK